MFSNEIKQKIMENWRFISFFIGLAIMMIGVGGFYYSYMFRTMIKESVKPLIDTNDKYKEVIDLFVKDLKIDHFIIMKLLNQMSDDELFELCISISAEYGTLIEDVSSSKSLNFKDYGIRQSVINKLLVYYHEKQTEQLNKQNNEPHRDSKDI
jgi:hypothetical protein